MQTKNVNVAQPSANKNEKNAVAAATVNVANQNGQTGNGAIVNGTSVSVAALNGQTSVPVMNGMNVNNNSHSMNGTTANSMNMNGGLVNGTGMNGQSVCSSSSPYQHLPITSANQHLVSSPYHPHPVTSSNQLIVSSSVTSPYQPPPLPPRVGAHRPTADLPQVSLAPATEQNVAQSSHTTPLPQVVHENQQKS
ncbi:uncharacterized protein LOC122242328 [Penaeus japonicus]|uniref:uncharacterized protein LOC122242328 n=1 Tax=Penaeus japonicus TaxID=27405 RepID=UPI001C71693B|nr:uncharacterized protein LOC122242328 [Penaeus japonicus]